MKKSMIVILGTLFSTLAPAKSYPCKINFNGGSESVDVTTIEECVTEAITLMGHSNVSKATITSSDPKAEKIKLIIKYK